MPAALTDPLVRLLRRLLGDNILGVYLHGSAVLAGLRPRSDIDLLVVVERPLTEAERRSLVAELLKVSGGPDRRPVELIVVRQGEVDPWRYPPNCEFLYGEWLRDEYERGFVPATAPMPDLAPLLTMVLQGDAPLYGPPPAALLAPVPDADLRRAIVEGVPELMGELGSDTRNVLLTLARIWVTLVTGTVHAKDAAAEWALERLPAEHRPALAWARAEYLGEEAGAAPEGVRQCADALARRVRAAAGQPS